MAEKMHDFPHDERTITDETFFKAIDLTRPELKTAREAYRQGDMDGTRRSVVDHFCTRRRPVWIFDLRGARPKQIIAELIPDWMSGGVDELIEHADAMLENRLRGWSYTEIDLGPDLNWHIPELQGKNSFSYMFKQMPYLTWLAAAYLITHEIAYVDKYVEILSKYLDEWPLVWENRSPSASTDIQSRSHHDGAMNIGKRTNTWIGLLYTDLPYDSRVPVDLTFRLIRSIWFAAWQFRRFDSHVFVPHNHHSFERGLLPFQFALMLPEFPAIRHMLERGRKVVAEHVAHDFSEDGGYGEHSTGYTVDAGAGGVFTSAERLAKANGTHVLSRRHKTIVRNCYDITASLVMPNGYLPSIGDGHGPYCRQFLTNGHEVFGSKACGAVMQALKMAKGSAKTEDLPALWVQYVGAGYVAGRDGWTPKSNYGSSLFGVGNLPPGTTCCGRQDAQAAGFVDQPSSVLCQRRCTTCCLSLRIPS